MTDKNLFGNPSGSSTTTSGNMFGFPAPTNTQGTGAAGASSTTPATTSLFGKSGTSVFGGTTGAFGNTSATSVFGTPKPAEQAGGSTTPAQKVPNFFGSSAASTTPSNAFGSTSGGFFGSKPADTTAKPATSSTPSEGGLGGLFGKKPETATTASTSTGPAPLSAFSLSGNKDATSGTSTPTASLSGGLFGNLGANKDPKGTSSAPAPAPAPTPAFNLFGPPKDTSADKKDAPAATTAAFSLTPPTTSTASTSKAPDKQPSTTTPISVTPAASTSAISTAVAVPPPSALKGKTIEEIINKWSTDLETHVREFNKFAGEVAVWDRALIENGNNLAALYSHVLAAEREQNDIDQSLDHIEQQQKDLAATLEVYEKSTQEILGGQGGSLRALDTGPADSERDKNYMLATDLHTHLDDLSTSLTQIIESVNALSQPPDGASKGSAGEDPMAQIAQILSSHLESLQWIDGAVREVEGKVTEIEKRVKESGGGLMTPGTNGSKYRSFGGNR